WAEHLLKLVLVLRPDDRPALVLLARSRWKRGEIEETVALLEKVRTPTPERFASGDDEDAWYLSCQLLGDLYLNDLVRPDLGVPCLTDFRKSAKSGAKTWFRLGQAHELLGDIPRAVKCYKQATAYEGNPFAHEAHDALSRLGVKA